jgi:uncharacterized membrane protein
MNCPKCGYENPPTSQECFQCKIIFTKYDELIKKKQELNSESEEDFRVKVKNQSDKEKEQQVKAEQEFNITIGSFDSSLQIKIIKPIIKQLIKKHPVLKTKGEQFITLMENAFQAIETKNFERALNLFSIIRSLFPNYKGSDQHIININNDMDVSSTLVINLLQIIAVVVLISGVIGAFYIWYNFGYISYAINPTGIFWGAVSIGSGIFWFTVLLVFASVAENLIKIRLNTDKIVNQLREENIHKKTDKYWEKIR